MAALHEALKCLTATSWDKVPTDESNLRTYINDLRTKARLIVDSVPEPPPPPTDTGSSTTVKLSHARLEPTNESTRALQDEWSKPIKIKSGKDNPLGIHVYKLPGADGQGHWFGRRSVHQGLPFRVWEEKLSSEISETLRKNQERMKEGYPPDQAVRGIGAQRRIEEIEVKDEKGEGVVGYLNVYHVSASFPPPTTPRDFVPLIITWEDGGSKSLEGVVQEEKRAGRSWMMVSRPCEHPDAPPVQDHIRGQYESVEMVREIAVADEDSESNPVEWIMVTRSNPGGTIPRWMVEKGTPKSICSDAVKFLDWASQDTDPAKEQPAASQDRVRGSTTTETSQRTTTQDESESSESDFSEYEEEHNGLIATFGHLLTAGIERYAPQAVLDYIPQHSRRISANNVPDADSHADTPQSRDDTHESRESKDEDSREETRSRASLNSDNSTEPRTPGDINLDVSTAEILQRTQKGKLSTHERHLAKLSQEKRSVEAQLELVRTDIHSLGLRPPPTEVDAKREKGAALSSDETPNARNGGSPASSISQFGTDDRTSSSGNLRGRAETATPTPTPSPSGDHRKMTKVASSLFREESKLLRRLSKIERHQVKEVAKLEARQRKEAEKHDKARSRDETETLRREIDQLRKECDRLKSERKKWLGLIGSLQAENTKLARQVGGGSGATSPASGAK
ncbi:hypothetical protein BJX61DRAFT_184115 [Aspergillus egyptiacus]|nr:hypothetical protein BJX61DRAFT_184115 [Aspergillus egyptiacus]